MENFIIFVISFFAGVFTCLCIIFRYKREWIEEGLDKQLDYRLEKKLELVSSLAYLSHLRQYYIENEMYEKIKEVDTKMSDLEACYKELKSLEND